MERRNFLAVAGLSVAAAVGIRKAEGRSLNSSVCLEEVPDFDVMGCISPVCLRLGKKLQFVPCGKCNFCLESRRADWSFRLYQESKVSRSNHFLTLTYDEKNLPWSDEGPSLCKADVQLFTKRLRHVNHSDGWPSIRYYTVGEYGSDTERPHYHSIMFNLQRNALEGIQGIWGKGHVDVGTVTPASIHYVTGYAINRVGEWEGRQKPFSLISNRSGGLGVNYVASNRAWHKGDVLRNYVMKDGFRMKLPRFYKDKVFSVREKEELGKVLLAELTESERVELLELAKFHPDPLSYLNERIVNAYNKIGYRESKSSEL